MSTNYPGGLDSLTNPVGTNTLDNPDHAAQHSNVNDATEAMQVTVGTTAGTNILMHFAAGQFPVRNTGGGATGTLVQTLVGGSFTGAVVNNSTFGTNASVGGTSTNEVINGGTLGSAVSQSGTFTSPVITRAINVSPAMGTLTDQPSGTITADMATAQVFSVIMGTNAVNRTIGTPSNILGDGASLTYRVKQNAANVGTLVWHPIFRMSSDIGTPSLGTASTWNYYAWRWNVLDTKFDFVGQSKNVI